MRASPRDVSHFEQGFKYLVRVDKETRAYTDTLEESLQEARDVGGVAYGYEKLAPVSPGAPETYILQVAKEPEPEIFVPVLPPLPEPMAWVLPTRKHVSKPLTDLEALFPKPVTVAPKQEKAVAAKIADPVDALIQRIMVEVGVTAKDDITDWHAMRVAQFLRWACGENGRADAQAAYERLVGGSRLGMFERIWPLPVVLDVPKLDGITSVSIERPVAAKPSSAVVSPEQLFRKWGTKRRQASLVSTVLLLDCRAAARDIATGAYALQDYQDACVEGVVLGAVSREQVYRFLESLQELTNKDKAVSLESAISDAKRRIEPKPVSPVIIKASKPVLSVKEPSAAPVVEAPRPPQSVAVQPHISVQYQEVPKPVKPPEKVITPTRQSVDTQPFSATPTKAIAMPSRPADYEAAPASKVLRGENENLIEALYVIDRFKGGSYRADEFVHRGLGAYGPSNSYVRKLEQQGLVKVSRVGAISATKLGREKVASEYRV